MYDVELQILNWGSQNNLVRVYERSHPTESMSLNVSTDSQEIRVDTPHELYPHAMEVTFWETLSDTFDLLITCATVEAYFGILSI